MKKLYFSIGIWVLSLTIAGNTYAGDFTWVLKTPMQQSRSHSASVALNGKIYAIGGYVGGHGGTASVEEYDPAADTWTSEAPILHSVWGLRAAAAAGKIYIFGGANNPDGNSTHFSTVEEYDPSTNTWTTKSPMSEAKYNMAIGVFNDKIYIIGGSRGDIAFETTEQYDPLTDTWTTKTPMPVARHLGYFAATPDKIFLFGDPIYVYDMGTDSWSTRAAPPFDNAYGPATAAMNGKIYVFGGKFASEGAGIPDVYEYDLFTETWSAKAPMVTGVSHLWQAASVVGNKVYVLGGQTAYPTQSTTLVQEGTLKPIDITIGRTIDALCPYSLVYRDDGFWVIGWSIADGARLHHYSVTGVLLGDYSVPEEYSVQGLAWDGEYWWIADNIHPSGDKIEKCELTSTGLNVLKEYVWPGPGSGPVALEWAEGYLYVSENHTDTIYRVTVGADSLTSIEAWSTCPAWGWEPWGLAWDGQNIWSLSGPAGSRMGCNVDENTSGLREIYKHDANGNIIEIWHYPPADDPEQGSYGGFGTGLAFAGSQLWYCDYDRNQIIEAIFSQPAGGWIAFSSNQDGDPDIWAVRPDGTGLRQLTNLPGAEYTPQWSPDSSRIVYVTGPVQIWVYDWFAGTNTKIYDAHDYQGQDLGSYSAYWPAWSPDGSKILYAEEFSYNDPHIMVINSDGTGRAEVPVQSGFVTIPSWCPSGTAFVYNRRSGASYSEDLWIYDFTATGNIMNGVNHQLTQGANSESTIKYYADWTPSGDIVFVWGHNLAIIDPGQSPNWNGPVSNPLDPHVTFLTNDASLPSPRYLWPSWSPDLSQIVYGYYSGNWDLWIMDASGGNRRQLTATSSDEASPDWGNPTAQPVTTLYVDALNGDDNNDGLTPQTAFAGIQKGINSAEDGIVVLVYPGLYTEEVDFKGKAITVQGVATQSGIPIVENPGDFAVSFYNGEGPGSILKNFVVRNSFMAIFLAGSSPTIQNVNIVDNKYGIDAYAGAEPDISNCIFRGNSDSDLFGCEARYSCTSQSGQSNISEDPMFADPTANDFHLKSQAGRWDANEGRWTIDDVTSPCIDAGDPMSSIGPEPFPNGGIINMGAYGGTAEASKSYFGEPTCQTIVTGDINGDCKINFEDFRLMALHWCEERD